MSEAYTREEQYLSAIAEGTVPDLTPITRKEMFLAAAAGQNVTPPEPITREEILMSKIQSGGGGNADPNAIARSILDKSITEYSDGTLTNLADYAFYNCKSITSINLPNLTSITGMGTFQACSGLVELLVPKLKGLSKNFCASCTNLKKMVFPSLTAFSNGCFTGCSSLESLDFYHAFNIQYTTNFNNCKKLRVMIFRSETGINTLASVANFSGSPFAEGNTGGVLLAPSALVESYKTETNWSVLYGYGTNRFLALEDYTVDGTITGEIDWDKVNALFEEA